MYCSIWTQKLLSYECKNKPNKLCHVEEARFLDKNTNWYAIHYITFTLNIYFNWQSRQNQYQSVILRWVWTCVSNSFSNIKYCLDCNNIWSYWWYFSMFWQALFGPVWWIICTKKRSEFWQFSYSFEVHNNTIGRVSKDSI